MVGKRVFDRLLETFLEVMVEAADKGEPLTLDAGASANEQVVSFHKLVTDNIKRLLEVDLFLNEAVLLLLDEFLEHVEFLLDSVRVVVWILSNSSVILC
jgi:hypothetical protein